MHECGKDAESVAGRPKDDIPRVLKSFPHNRKVVNFRICRVMLLGFKPYQVVSLRNREKN